MESVSAMAGFTVVNGYAQHLGDVHRHGGAAASDVGRTLDQAHGAVRVDGRDRGGRATSVEPRATGNSASAQSVVLLGC